MKNLYEFSDEILFDKVKEENCTVAFEEIYNRYWDKLYAAAFKRIKSNEAAEEVIQELFVNIWARRGRITIHSNLGVYLFTAVKYKVLNYIHHENVRVNYHKMLQLKDVDLDNSTEETIMLGELNRQLNTHIQHLPSKCREVFDLSRNKNKSNREIATFLGISEKTVENHITKALQRLKISLNSFLLFF